MQGVYCINGLDEKRALELLSLSRGHLWDNVVLHKSAVEGFDEESTHNYFCLEESRLNYISDELEREFGTWEGTYFEENNRAWMSYKKKNLLTSSL